jgi:hypothetical protein
MSGVCPSMGLTGSGIPNDSKDPVLYEQWQRDRWSRLEAECNVQNMGTGYVDPTKIVGQHKFGRDD